MEVTADVDVQQLPPITKLTLRNAHLQQTFETAFDESGSYVTKLQTDSARVGLTFPLDVTTGRGITLKMENLEELSVRLKSSNDFIIKLIVFE